MTTCTLQDSTTFNFSCLLCLSYRQGRKLPFWSCYYNYYITDKQQENFKYMLKVVPIQTDNPSDVSQYYDQ